LRWSLASKIFIGFSIILAMFGTVTIYGVAKLGSLRLRLGEVNQGLLPLRRSAGELSTLLEVTRKTIDSVVRFDNVSRQRRLLERRQRYFLRDFDSRLQTLTGRLAQVERMPHFAQQQGFFGNIRKNLDAVHRTSDQFGSTLEQLVQSIDVEMNIPPDVTLVRNLERQGRVLAGLLSMLERAIRSRTNATMLHMEYEANQASGVILWLTGLAVLVSILVTVLSLRALRPVRQLVEAAQRISRGDFGQQVEYQASDELGLLVSEFNRMARSLSRREEDLQRHRREMERINLKLRQSGLDLELMKLYNENIIRSIPAGIVVLDPQGLVTTINPTACRLWNLDPERDIGLPLKQLAIAASLADIISNWEQILQGQGDRLYEALEFQVDSADGPGQRTLLVDLNVTALVGTDGNVQGVLLVGEDVTEKVRTKQALIQSERLATIGRMSAMVAHEIRNPLSSIGLNTELLQEEIAERLPAESEEATALLKSICREVDRLTEVTDEYLRFARLPKPQLVPEHLPVILQELLQFVAGELREAGIELHERLQSDLPPVKADANQLRQAFLNLLRNSMESMPQGGRLTVSSEAVDGLVRVRISDTGRGIDPDSLDHIFDPFFSTRENGTGLGLSLTQQIVSEHGGHIRCESRPGQGTAFVVELPTVSTPPDPGNGQQQSHQG